MKTRVLIVEDEAIIAINLKSDLLKSGYDILPIASTADKAVLLAREHKPDIILMDVILKGKKTGIDAAGQIVAESRIPILFLTGNVHLLEGSELVEKLQCAVLAKPATGGELRHAIEKTLHKGQNYDN